MGQLSLPASGLVYLDAQTIIYSVETQNHYWPLLEPLWQKSEAGTIKVITSDLSLLEALIGPLKHNDRILLQAYNDLFVSSELSLLPISQDILRDAAVLRSQHPSLRTPDAIHLASAQQANCSLFVTNDLRLRVVPSSFPHIYLNDLL